MQANSLQGASVDTNEQFIRPPRLKYGMNLRTRPWSRITLCIASVIFLIVCTVQYRKCRSNYAYLSEKCSELVVHSGGLSAQLQLLMERNHRTEKLLVDLRARYNRVVVENNEKLQNAQVQCLACKATLKKCLAEATTDGKQLKNREDTDSTKHLFVCQRELRKSKKQIERLEEERRNISIIKGDCGKLLINSKLTPSPKTNYIQNGKVHFKRVGHLNEELEFRRDPAAPQLPIILSKKELLSKLTKRNERQKLIHDDSLNLFDNPGYDEYKDYKDA